MKPLRLVPKNTHVPFMRWRNPAIGLSALGIVASIVLFLVMGLNFGIDFRGGTLVEVRTEGPADIEGMRNALNALELGEVSLQEFGQDTDVLIRIQRQDGDEAAQQAAVQIVRDVLDTDFGPVDYRRIEFVGPQVSDELIEKGIMAVLIALGAMLIYIWLRFEWQFSLGAVIALLHDVILTIGLFSLTQLDFGLPIVAALLTIVGYSMNDTVVIYDRVRENLRKYKKLPLVDLLDKSLNDTLSRTIMTSGTTLLALFALYFFGGEVIAGFTLAMIWGVIIGTYSSVFVAAPLLLYLRPGRRVFDRDEDKAEDGEEDASADATP
ncbi:MAG: protein translocase subunit SecF [Pseudomonadota bacterium]